MNERRSREGKGDGLLSAKDGAHAAAVLRYPCRTHRLTYRRIHRDNIHGRGYKEEGTITTPFDMTALNDLDRFPLGMDTIERLPQTGDKGVALQQQLQEKLVEHKQYIDKHGQDLPEISNWQWGQGGPQEGKPLEEKSRVANTR